MTIVDLGKRALVMGIVNVTPDSFSGDGLMQGAVELALRMIGEGADILDIGGESSRPGAVPVAAEEETRRVVPVIAAIRKSNASVSISIDTVKAAVAAAAIDAGATIVNDITALQGDAEMAALAAGRGVYVVLMHNRAQTSSMDERIGGQFDAPKYGDVVEDVARDLGERIKVAQVEGIAAEKIITDPGLGFGKTVAQNCALINRVDVLKQKLGCPVLIGPSRKSFIGRVLDLPVEERLGGAAAAVAASVLRGADIVRVHDVKEMARVVRMTQAIKDESYLYPNREEEVYFSLSP